MKLNIGKGYTEEVLGDEVVFRLSRPKTADWDDVYLDNAICDIYGQIKKYEKKNLRKVRLASLLSSDGEVAEMEISPLKKNYSIEVGSDEERTAVEAAKGRGEWYSINNSRQDRRKFGASQAIAGGSGLAVYASSMDSNPITAIFLGGLTYALIAIYGLFNSFGEEAGLSGKWKERDDPRIMDHVGVKMSREQKKTC